MAIDAKPAGGGRCTDDKLAEKRVGLGDTWHTCAFTVDNQTGGTIDWIAITHVAGGSTDSQFWQNVGTGIYGSTMTINFSTGWNADADYWYIVYGFDGSGQIWGNDGIVVDGSYNGTLMCNLTSSDKGGTGYIRLYSFSSAECVPPVSSNCSFSPNDNSILTVG